MLEQYWDHCVIGVDPGSRSTGVAIVDATATLVMAKAVHHPRTHATTAVMRLFRYIRSLAHEYHPIAIAIELPRAADSSNTMFMHWIVGSLMCLQDARVKNGRAPDVLLYDDWTIKGGLVGEYAEKETVRAHVEARLQATFTSPITENGTKGGHDSDAAAVALYCLEKIGILTTP